MKARKKYFTITYVTDLYPDEEVDIFCAEDESAVAQRLRNLLGEHLLACEIRTSTWAERRYYKKTHKPSKIATM